MTDYKFDIDGKKLSSEEINAKKDFDSFMKGVKVQGKAFYQKGWFWASTGLATVAVAALIMLGGSNNQALSNKTQPVTPSVITKTTEQPFINPPFDGLSVEGDVFKVDANKGGIFKNRHGSILRIPALAFLTRKGKTIKNQTVDVKFTEFKDVADQIISGIPMTYDSAGTKYMFSSAGMVEIRGFIGDSAVSLNPEKPIEVEMKSNNPSNEYNFYCLNEKDKKWDYRGKASIGHHEQGKLSDEQIKAQFPEVKKSDIVVPDNLVEAELQKVPEFQKAKRNRVGIQAEIDGLTSATPVKPIKADANVQKFSLDIIEKENPELMPYKDVQFQLAPGEKISPQHTNQNWNNVDVIKGEENDVIITFSKTNSSEKVQYKAIPVLEGEAFEKAHAAYMEHASSIKGKKEELANIKKQIKFMKKRAKDGCMNKAVVAAKLERLERIATLEKNNLENGKTINKVTRYFTANNFGVYNCDRAVEMGPASKPLITNITFTKNVNEISAIHVFPKLNGIFKATGQKGMQFSRYANSSHVIGIKKNQLGIMKPLMGGEMEFTVLGKPKSKGDLVAWLEL